MLKYQFLEFGIIQLLIIIRLQQNFFYNKIPIIQSQFKKKPQTTLKSFSMPTYKQKKQKLRQLVKQQEQQRINKIKQQGHNFVDSDQFKRQQKHYKFYQHRETDYSEMIRVEDLKCQLIDGFKVYELKEPEGAFLVKDFISLREQYIVGFQALNEYIFRPYRTNLDGTNGLYHENVHAIKNQEDVIENKEEENSILMKPEDDKQSVSSYQNNKLEQPKHQQQIGHKIDIKLQNQKILQQIDFSNPHNKYYFNQKIRMSNLGYQYDWPHRSYPATRVSIPQTITNLTKKAANLYQKIKKQQIKYHGEAVIINYYKNKDYMTGHLDDGEQDQINPIFSFCFGLSCVFLLGYPTRNQKPHAIRLDAGDLMIMSGFSRICYHGVPRIIEGSYDVEAIENKQQIQDEIQEIKAYMRKTIELKKDQLKDTENIDKRYLNDYEHVKNYYKEHRINVNVRQVWVRKGQQKKIMSEQKIVEKEH